MVILASYIMNWAARIVVMATPDRSMPEPSTGSQNTKKPTILKAQPTRTYVLTMNPGARTNSIS